MTRGRSFLRGPRDLSTSSFGSQVIITTATNFALALFALVSGSMVARLLGPTGRGELAAIQTWAAFLALLASLGLPDAVVYFSGREPARSATYLISAIVLLLCAAVLFVAVGYLLLPFFLSAQTTETVVTGRQYLTCFLLLMATQGMLLHPLRGRQDFIPWNLLRLLYAILWIAALVVLILTSRSSARAVASAYVVSLIVGAACALLVVVRRIPRPFRLDSATWPPMLRFGVPLAIGSLPQMLNLRLDQLAMAALMPAALLGQYAVAVAWSSAVSPLMQGVGAVLFPRVAAQGSLQQQAISLAAGVRLTVLIGVSTGGLLLLLTVPAIRIIFGSDFTPAIPAALILVVAGIIAGLNGVLEEGARGLNATSAVLWAEVAGLAGTLIGLILLLKPLGIVGAAIVSTFGYTITMAVLLVRLRALTGAGLATLLVPTISDLQQVAQGLKRMMNSLSAGGEAAN